MKLNIIIITLPVAMSSEQSFRQKMVCVKMQEVVRLELAAFYVC